MLENKKPENLLWKTARWGMAVGLIIHFISSLILTEIAHRKFNGAPVVISFFITRWFIKSQKQTGWKYEYKFVYGLIVSLVIFLIQIVLGEILFFIILRK